MTSAATEPIIASAAARGKEGKRLIHLTLPGDEPAPLCGALAVWGWSRTIVARLRPCPRCQSKAARL